MAGVTIRNLDEMIAQQDVSFVTWKGKDHEVVGMTVGAFLKYQQLQKAQGIDESDEGKIKGSLDLLCIVVPSFSEYAEELRGLKLPVLDALVKFVLAAAGLSEKAADAAGDGKDSGTEAGAEEPGESTRPS